MSDAHFYEAMTPGSRAERLGLKARTAMFQDMMRLVAPSPDAKIADIGVSDVETSAANLFEKLYPYPENITCCGLTSVALPSGLRGRVAFTHIEPGAAFPFENNAFDVLVSNAVLEHVGDRSDQINFLIEAKRVAKTLFITVPHQYFPVEHHTGVPLLHYVPGLFRSVIRQFESRKMWADPKTLSFFSERALADLARDAFCGDVTLQVGITGIWPRPIASNLFLFVR